MVVAAAPLFAYAIEKRTQDGSGSDCPDACTSRIVSTGSGGWVIGGTYGAVGGGGAGSGGPGTGGGGGAGAWWGVGVPARGGGAGAAAPPAPGCVIRPAAGRVGVAAG
ncbi:hypothetical protein [Parafrankia elaeagni]|uniref:hypothetical protein n=1 Tax=Parafrankia elaeagni TaxID=222534 RepID=UPI0003664068|nr:hypothetical protein [Parafrankia elaeagni]